MPGFLLHLQGPMQSWADTGFGQLREAGLFPSRAAVLGIVAAAQGVPREDERLVVLHDAFQVHAVCVRRGQVLKDYHTVETTEGRSKTLTWRDYHHDAHFVALLRSDDEGAVNNAVDALRDPIYTTYLGRRSCPPAIPLLPLVVDDAGVHAMLEAAESARLRFPTTEERRWRSRTINANLVLYLDGHFTRETLPAPLTGRDVSYGTRRDRLVSPWRAYVNRPYTRVSFESKSSEDDAQQSYFDAAS